MNYIIEYRCKCGEANPEISLKYKKFNACIIPRNITCRKCNKKVEISHIIGQDFLEHKINIKGDSPVDFS